MEMTGIQRVTVICQVASTPKFLVLVLVMAPDIVALSSASYFVNMLVYQLLVGFLVFS